jgi:hypothetical protein
MKHKIVGAKNFSPLRDVKTNNGLERRADGEIGSEVAAIVDPSGDP